MLPRRALTAAAVLVAALVLAACGATPRPAGTPPTLTISAIPDQDPQKLQQLHDQVARYLGDRLGVPVRYRPVPDYDAAVAGFRRDELQLVFFGGLTAAQARAEVGATVLMAQRDIDENFHSVFVARRDAGVAPIRDVAGLTALRGKSVTFGSPASASGRLMPQFFLLQAGVGVTGADGGTPGFSGSHDATIKAVESGAYQVGALNAAVWDARVEAGQVDTAKVTEVFRTPPYHDYLWQARPGLDARFGAGFTDRARAALLDLDGSDQQERDILAGFTAGRFVPTTPESYAEIESVARQLGLVS